jgi:methanogenic corrinoid protein MtbC1
MPTAEIASSALAFDAKLTLLSASLSTQISTIGAVIDRIRQVAGETKILVGGLAFEAAPDLWHELGADAYASDVRSAVAMALKLISND